jgi:hypothetical protein
MNNDLTARRAQSSPPAPLLKERGEQHYSFLIIHCLPPTVENQLITAFFPTKDAFCPTGWDEVEPRPRYSGRGSTSPERGLPSCATRLPSCATRLPSCATRLPSCATRLPSCTTRLPSCATRLPSCATRLPSCATRLPSCATRLPSCATRLPSCATRLLFYSNLNNKNTPLCTHLDLI